jgi:hypothetical protein
VTGGAGLERGYRRLLACYPARFRGEHGEELVAVLLAGARDGQRRPALAESASLLRSGLGMRLRPDASRSARQGWADALAAFSLAGPVFLLATTVLVTLAWSFSLGRGFFTTLLGLPGFWITLGLQAVLAALVLAGRRRAALVMTAAAGGYFFNLNYLAVRFLTFTLWSPAVLRPLAISVCIVELAALLGSPGPRRGRDLVHWGHGLVLVLCAAALASCQVLLGTGRDPAVTLLVMGIVVAVIARLARAVRLSRYFRLLLAALACPCALLLASLTFSWPWFNPTSYQCQALTFAGPVLTAAVAVISTVRPRRRQIISVPRPSMRRPSRGVHVTWRRAGKASASMRRQFVQNGNRNSTCHLSGVSI